MAEPKSLTKAQKVVLEALSSAQSIGDLMLVVSALTPVERNDKRIGFPIHQATERIINQVVPLR